MPNETPFIIHQSVETPDGPGQVTLTAGEQFVRVLLDSGDTEWYFAQDLRAS